MNRKLFFYSVCLLFIVKECTTAVILTQVPEAVEENDGLQLLCTVPVSDLSTTVSFLKDGAQKGQCTAPLPGVAPGSCASNIEQDIQTGVTTYNISAATNAELGSWSCELGVQPSNQLDVLIVVRGALTNNQWNLPSVISDNAELLNVEIGCCYPQPSVQWKKQICSQTDLTNVATNPNVMVNGSVSCTLPKKAYTSSLPVRNIANPSKQTCYKPKAEISYSTNLPTDASTFTSEVIIEGHKTAPEEPTIMTEESTIGSSVISTVSTQSTTIRLGTDIPVIGTKRVLVPLVLTVSIVNFCLILISVITICIVYCKRNCKGQYKSDNSKYRHPSSNEQCDLQNKSGGADIETNSSLQSRPTYNSEIAADYCGHQKRDIQQRQGSYENRNRVDNEADGRGKPLEYHMPYVYDRNTHDGFIRQPRQIHVTNDYILYNAHTKAGILNPNPNYSYSNNSFY